MRTLLLVACLCCCSQADTPSKALKQAIRTTGKAASHRQSIEVRGGTSSNEAHSFDQLEIDFCFESQTWKKVSYVQQPADAYQLRGAREGAIFQDGRWGALSGWDAGWLILKLHRPLEELLAELKGLSKRAEWLDEEAGLLRLEGPAELALAHYDNILNTNARWDQAGDMHSGSTTRWEAVDRADRRQVSISYTIQLDPGQDTIREVRSEILVAMRNDRPAMADQTFALATHMVFVTTTRISELDAVERFEVPLEAQRFLR